MKCCDKDMEWIQIAWDISREGYLINFGFWRCNECKKTLGGRSNLQERKFLLPEYSAEKLMESCL